MESLAAVAQSGVTDQLIAHAAQAAPQAQPVDRSQAAERQQSADAAGQSKQKNPEAIVKELNDAMKMFNTTLSFSVDKDTGTTVIKVMDSQTKQVIRQIPPDDMLRTASRIKDLLGVLFDKKQ